MITLYKKLIDGILTSNKAFNERYNIKSQDHKGPHKFHQYGQIALVFILDYTEKAGNRKTKMKTK